MSDSNTSSKAPRHSPLRARRRRTRVLIGLGLLTLAALAAYGVSSASYLPQFSIHNVVVVGTKEIRAELVEAYAEAALFDGTYALLSSSNIFLYKHEKIVQAVQDHLPRVRSVNVSRGSLLAQAVVVSIEERASFARWCGKDTCFLMDESGFIFALQATSSISEVVRYTFTGALPKTGDAIGQTLVGEKFGEFVALLKQLEDADFAPLEISVESTQDFSVSLARGFVLHASFNNDLEKVARDLELVLGSNALRGKESQLEYVDLRFGNRVYYKFKGQAVQEQ